MGNFADNETVPINILRVDWAKARSHKKTGVYMDAEDFVSHYRVYIDDDVYLIVNTAVAVGEDELFNIWKLSCEGYLAKKAMEH